MDENRIEQKQDWTKSFGPKPVGRKALDQNPLDEKVLDENWAHAENKIGHQQEMFKRLDANTLQRSRYVEKK